MSQEEIAAAEPNHKLRVTIHGRDLSFVTEYADITDQRLKTLADKVLSDARDYASEDRMVGSLYIGISRA